MSVSIARRRMVSTVAVVLLGATAWAFQYPIGRPTGDTVPPLGAGHGQEDTNGPFGVRELQAHQLKLLRQEHQKQVKADTERLLHLATELKALTDQGVTTSPSELKDVDEIARLAKKLSERIKDE